MKEYKFISPTLCYFLLYLVAHHWLLVDLDDIHGFPKNRSS